jgi:cytochrome c oxidase assembly factor CtaG
LITLLNGLPRPLVNRVLMPVLRCPSVRKLESNVAHPVLCWLASTAAVIAWHIPALFELALRSESWHGVEYVCFFAAGLLFWWPVVQPWPSAAAWSQWTVPLYLFLATLPCDALSAFLTFGGRVVYPNYLTSHRMFSISPLADQECAGALMWVCVTFAYLAPAVAVAIRILSSSETLPKDEDSGDPLRQPLHLALPHDMQSFVALNRPPSAIRSRRLAGIDPLLDRTIVLLPKWPMTDSRDAVCA